MRTPDRCPTTASAAKRQLRSNRLRQTRPLQREHRHECDEIAAYAPERCEKGDWIMSEIDVNVSTWRVLPTWRVTTARVLLGIAAAGAFASFVLQVGQTMDAGPATQAVEAWRMVGLAAFAGLFALLAWRPLAYPGVFEIAIGSKAALALLGLTILASADHASELVVFDGTLTAVLVAAYLLADGWTAWRSARRGE